MKDTATHVPSKQHYINVLKDLTRRQVIPVNIAETLALLPDERLSLALATLIIDIPHLRQHHVDLLITADSSADFERALQSVKREISTPTLDLYAQIVFAALIRYLGIADLACRQNTQDPETAIGVTQFVCDKILRPAWGMLSLISRTQDTATKEQIQRKMKRWVNEYINF